MNAQKIAILLALLTFSITPGHAQSLSGQLFLQNPHGPHPVPAAGYKVYLYSRVGQAWIGPVLTDSQGRYAFFNRPNGDYLLRVIQSDKQVFEQQVTIPVSLAPIVL